MYVFPNFNMQDLNLDWILQQIKNMATELVNQNVNNEKALSLSLEQSNVLAEFLTFFPEGSYSVVYEDGRITHISFRENMSDEIENICNAWLGTQQETMQEVINAATEATTAAETAATEARTASSSYDTVYHNLILTITALSFLNSQLGAKYECQYLNNTYQVVGERWNYNTDTHKIEPYTDNTRTRYLPVYAIPPGVYSYVHLSQVYTFIEYIHDGSAHELREFLNDTKGTVNIPYQFNLYVATGNAANTIAMWCKGYRYPSDENYYTGVKSYRLEINEKFKNYQYKYQYVFPDSGDTGMYWNSSLAKQTNASYTALDPISLKPGTYTFQRILGNSRIVDVGRNVALNTVSGYSASNPYTVTFDSDTTIYPNVNSANYIAGRCFIVNTNSINNMPKDGDYGYYYNSFNDIVNILKSNPAYLYQMNTMRCVGHRGGDDTVAPQNTRASQIAARSHGIMYVENDVRLSSDGEYIMWHGESLMKCGNLVTTDGNPVYVKDSAYYYFVEAEPLMYELDGTATLDTTTDGYTRVNGSDITVANMSYEDFLSKISVGAYMGSAFVSERLMTLEECILLSKQLGQTISLDRKIAYTNAILDDMFELVQKYGMQYNVWFGGLTIEQMNYMRGKFKFQKFGYSAANIFTDDATAEEIEATLTALEPFNNIEHGMIISFNGKANGTDGVPLDSTKAQTVLAHNFDIGCFLVDTSAMTYAQVVSRIKELVAMGAYRLTLDGIRIDEVFADMY